MFLLQLVLFVLYSAVLIGLGVGLGREMERFDANLDRSARLTARGVEAAKEIEGERARDPLA